MTAQSSKTNLKCLKPTKTNAFRQEMSKWYLKDILSLDFGVVL